MEAQASIRSDEHNGTRARAYEKKEAQHDVHEPTTFERNNQTIMELMMGEEYNKYFWDEKHAL